MISRVVGVPGSPSRATRRRCRRSWSRSDRARSRIAPRTPPSRTTWKSSAIRSRSARSSPRSSPRRRFSVTGCLIGSTRRPGRGSPSSSPTPATGRQPFWRTGAGEPACERSGIGWTNTTVTGPSSSTTSSQRAGRSIPASPRTRMRSCGSWPRISATARRSSGRCSRSCGRGPWSAPRASSTTTSTWMTSRRSARSSASSWSAARTAWRS